MIYESIGELKIPLCALQRKEDLSRYIVTPRTELHQSLCCVHLNHVHLGEGEEVKIDMRMKLPRYVGVVCCGIMAIPWLFHCRFGSEERKGLELIVVGLDSRGGSTYPWALWMHLLPGSSSYYL